MSLTPGQRGALAVRMAIARHLERPIPKASRQDIKVLEAVKAFLVAKSIEAEVNEDDHSKIEDFRKGLASDLQRQRDAGRFTGGTVLAERLNELQSTLSATECVICHTGKDGPATEHINCCSGFGNLALSVERCVSEFYREFGAPEGLEPLPEVVYSTEHSDTHPFATEYGIVAGTTCDGEVTEPRVTLRLRHTSFVYSSLCQVPYILFHELTCHAFQGIRSRSTENADGCCGWTEGWMDELAFTLAERWAGDDPASRHEWLPKAGKEPVAHMRAYHVARCKPSSTLAAHHASRLSAAQETFHVLRSLLKGASKSWKKADKELSKFSIRLNAHSINADDRDIIAILLTEALDRPRGHPSVSDALWACRDFLEHDDPALLIADLEKSLRN